MITYFQNGGRTDASNTPTVLPEITVTGSASMKPVSRNTSYKFTGKDFIDGLYGKKIFL